MEQARQLVELLTSKGMTITTVESCTGGALASAITDIPGASTVFQQGYVTYSNESKLALAALLGDAHFSMMDSILSTHTVYSPQMAKAMAYIGRLIAMSTISIGVTGTFERLDPQNPVSHLGEVFVAIQFEDKCATTILSVTQSNFSRKEAKQYVVEEILYLTLKLLQD